MLRIACDAGHGGRDGGASSHGVVEKHVTLEVAHLLRDELRSMGHIPLMTRISDRYHYLEVRAKHANRHEADRFVSIHCNAALNPEASGIETWFYNGSERGQRLAAHVQAGLLLEFPAAKNRGIKEANFAVLRLTKMPAVLVELGFLTNPEERKLMTNQEWREKAARAIARGIVTA